MLREGLALAMAGAAMGLSAAFAIARTMDAVVFGLTTRDPITFTAVPILLVIIAIGASALPARRAARLDPLNTLREG